MSEGVSDEEKVAIAQYYLQSSPPGQIDLVLEGNNINNYINLTYIYIYIIYTILQRCTQAPPKWTS